MNRSTPKGRTLKQSLARGARLYRIGSRPVCALPSGATTAVRRAAANRMIGETPRRRLVKSALGVVATLPDRFGLVRLTDLNRLPQLSGINQILDSIALSSTSHVAVYWPPQPTRPRAYIHLIDRQARPIGFLKLAQRGEEEGLSRERDALLEHAGGGGLLRTPHVIAHGIDEPSATTWLLVEALPEGARPVESPPIDELVMEITPQSHHVVPDRLPTLTWWLALQEQLASAPEGFQREFSRVARQGVTVGRAHGDLTPHNMARASSKVWLFDWEDSSGDAPVGTDRFALALSGRAGADLARDIRVRRGPDLDGFVWSAAFGLANRSGTWPTIVGEWDKSRGPDREL